jgi:UDP-N-acetylenolpyruvoylglucosamine reductase
LHGAGDAFVRGTQTDIRGVAKCWQDDEDGRKVVLVFGAGSAVVLDRQRGENVCMHTKGGGDQP